MKTSILIRASFFGVTLSLLTGAAVCAASPFDGTWKASPEHYHMFKEPVTLALANGEFSNTFAAPPYTIKADGTDQKVAGHTDFDTESVTVVDSHTIRRTFKLQGKAVQVESTSVADDGKTAIFEVIDYTGAQPSTLRASANRVAEGVAGSHAVAGAWAFSKVLSLEGPGYTTVYALTDDGFTSSSNGQSYEAKFDGRKYPVSGDPAHTEVTVKKLPDGAIEERDYQQGELVGINRYRVAADGRTLRITNTDTKTHTTNRSTLAKAPGGP